MSLADFAFPPQQRLRTVSQQLRTLNDGSQASALGDLDTGAHAWGEWATTGYSPDRQPGAQQPYQDPYADLMSENAFEPHTAYPPRQASSQGGLGFDMHMALGGGDDELVQGALDQDAPLPLADGSHPGPLPLQLQGLPPAQPAQVRSHSSQACPTRTAHGSELTTPSARRSQPSPSLVSPLPAYSRSLPHPVGRARQACSRVTVPRPST